MWYTPVPKCVLCILWYTDHSYFTVFVSWTEKWPPFDLVDLQHQHITLIWGNPQCHAYHMQVQRRGTCIVWNIYFIGNMSYARSWGLPWPKILEQKDNSLLDLCLVDCYATRQWFLSDILCQKMQLFEKKKKEALQISIYRALITVFQSISMKYTWKSHKISLYSKSNMFICQKPEMNLSHTHNRLRNVHGENGIM